MNLSVFAAITKSLSRRARAVCCFALAVAVPAFAADQLTATELSAMAREHSPKLRAAVEARFSANDLKYGAASTARGADFFVALESAAEPKLVIDDGAPMPMEKVSSTGEETPLWIAATHLEPVGRLHQYHYIVNGASFGGKLDVAALTPLSYQQPGVPAGKLSEKLVHTSKIYDGLKSDYWIYVPAQYDPKIPAALMVFQDGEGYLDRNAYNPALNVIDNLIAQKKIPVMICVFIKPGDISGSPDSLTYDTAKAYSDRWHRSLGFSMRSTLYDTVSDRYDRFLRDELLAEVGAKYNLRKDAYSHAITGSSSGGICSFNAAWQMPDLFSRVISWIGSFESMQWKVEPGIPDGGQDYPDKILREPHRNIRVWLQDGANDLQSPDWGSWPMANIRMANSLKEKQYDFHFSFGKGTHNPSHGVSEFPEEMIWLWRDYDPAKTEQTFTQDPAEKDKPFFRVEKLNRDE